MTSYVLPSPPRLARARPDTGPSPFEQLDARLEVAGRSDIAALHQGRTNFPPAVVGPVDVEAFDLLAHEHSPTSGSKLLRGLIRQRAAELRGTEVDFERVVITAGATHAIDAILGAFLCPGDEVLVLSPQWLFVSGLARARHVRPVEVPVFLKVAADPTADIEPLLEGFVTSRTRAIYFNSPNNPTGARLDLRQLTTIAEFADRNDLWVIADNAYENFDYHADGFLDAGVLFPNRTFAVHTFSKTYSMPGYRIGYVVAPPGAASDLHALALHSVYAVSSLSQAAAAQALRGTSQVALSERRHRAAATRDMVEARLEVPHTRVTGGLYTFLDLERTGPDAAAFIDAALDRGVSLAHGSHFGSACRRWARMCFTAVDEALLVSAIDRLNECFARSTT